MLFRFLLAFCVCYCQMYSQELAPVNNYDVDEYKAGFQNWSISQGDDKTIYVANNEGLLVFRNVWDFYPSPNHTILRSVKAVNDVIYTGSYLDFGYWKATNTGRLQYTSLAKKLEKPFAEDEDFWNIIVQDHWVLFQSLRRIYSYNTKRTE